MRQEEIGRKSECQEREENKGGESEEREGGKGRKGKRQEWKRAGGGGIFIRREEIYP